MQLIYEPFTLVRQRLSRIFNVWLRNCDKNILFDIAAVTFAKEESIIVLIESRRVDGWGKWHVREGREVHTKF